MYGKNVKAKEKERKSYYADSNFSGGLYYEKLLRHCHYRRRHRRINDCLPHHRKESFRFGVYHRKRTCHRTAHLPYCYQKSRLMHQMSFLCNYGRSGWRRRFFGWKIRNLHRIRRMADRISQASNSHRLHRAG